jgi:hypothetical protein
MKARASYLGTDFLKPKTTPEGRRDKNAKAITVGHGKYLLGRAARIAKCIEASFSSLEAITPLYHDTCQPSTVIFLLACQISWLPLTKSKAAA